MPDNLKRHDDHEAYDQAPSIVHECTECILMQVHGLNYNDAHDCANMLEWPFRRSLVSIKRYATINPIQIAGSLVNSIDPKVYNNFISLVRHFKESSSET